MKSIDMKRYSVEYLKYIFNGSSVIVVVIDLIFNLFVVRI